jgi:oxygen-dependent protoporphyrinogen oxidase
VLLVYAEGTAGRLPDSSGFVAPAGALDVTAATLVSRKWPDETFGERAVVRGFVGAVGSERAIDAADDEIVARVARQLADLYPLPAVPEAAEVIRWPRAMPQYEVGHLDRVRAIEEGVPPGVFLVGQAIAELVSPTASGGRTVAERVGALRPDRRELGGPG